MLKITLTILVVLNCAIQLKSQQTIKWEHLSSKTGDLEAPNTGGEQTSVAIADFDNDGINDFCISERTEAPALVWYQRQAKGWIKHVIEPQKLTIEAGTIACDVDGDGDMDIIAGGDWQTNQIWWWENPYPNFDPAKGWNRYLIRNTGGNKSHDQLVGDFDGDGKPDLVFWAQGDNTLYFTRIPSNPKDQSAWKLIPVYTYYTDGQMEQLGQYPEFKGVNEHEGLAKADIDMNGVQDIIGGGKWFKYLGNDKFSTNDIDAGYSFSRSGAAQLIKGGRPEIVLVVGDGKAPMNLYEYQKGTWLKKVILSEVTNGHSLSLIDFNNDGNMDIWNAEMTLGGNTNAVNHILLGDGKGNFTNEILVSKGIDIHESEMADLDGDGDLDILGKPFNGDVPRLDVWLQNGTAEQVSKRSGSFTQPFGLELYSLRFQFKTNVPGTLTKIKELGIKDVEISDYYGYTAKEFKKLIDKNNLKCSSMVFGYEQFEKDIDNIISEAQLFGAKYVGIGWVPHNESFNKKLANKCIQDFNRYGEKIKKAGLRFFYHPHGYEFNTSDGNLFDVILEHTNPELVTFQLDVFWFNFAGVDPLTYLKKYPGRFELMHLKELRANTYGNNTGLAADETSVSLGRGDTNWPIILRAAVKSGVKKFYIEDEAKTAVDQIYESIKFLNGLK